ncbi:hypothetical protein GCM10009096_15820 [Parasphingorhabdus litoris]|uniref:HNH domain-containing protein n=1 Tax=Parasphingorhabdus litoris TaxID=394733 RepID=A0ABP3KAM2_9SPHN|nr:HNH endonuclease [Parasphingorhabdus litoris]
MEIPRPYRECLLDPIPEIYEAADLLRRAVEAHLAGCREDAANLFGLSDIEKIGDWTNKIWGKHDPIIHKVESYAGAPPLLPKGERVKVRMPNRAERSEILARDGYICRFCSIPLVPKEVRSAMVREYPNAVKWGKKNRDQNFALQAMWLQFDHLLPHSRGGGNELANIITTCAPCNFGRMAWTIEELGLVNPKYRQILKTDWNGLVHFQ